MKKILVIVISAFLMVAPLQVYANSLDQIVTQNEEQSQNSNNKDAESNETNSYESDSSSVINILRQNSDMQKEQEITKKLSSPMIKASSIAVQLLFYIITLAAPVSTLADLGYLTIPFLRRPNTSGGNTSSGENSYGGYSRPASSYTNSFNSYSNQNNSSYSSSQSNSVVPTFIIVPVSNDVVSIANSDLKFTDKIKAYIKDSIIKSVASVALASLVVSGVMTRLALTLGDAVGNAIGSAAGMI